MHKKHNSSDTLITSYKYETLSGEEIKDLLAGKVIQQKTEDDDETDGKPAGSVPSTKKPKKKSDNIGSDPIPES